MKKKVALMVCAVLMLSMCLGGCQKVTKDKNGTVYNEKWNEKEMTSVDGTKVTVKDNDQVKINKNSGLGFVTPDTWKSVTNQDGIDAYDYGPIAYYLYYMPKAETDKVNAITDDTPEEEQNKIWDEAYGSEVSVFAIYRVNPEDKDTDGIEDQMKEEFSKSEKIGSIGKDTFYIAFNEEIKDEQGSLSEEDKADIKILSDSISQVKKSTILFPPVNPMEDFKASLSEFSTKDLDGKEVTQDILSKYDVTMVNVWATWCQYCVAEMPEIEALYQEIPDNVNIITICSDADTEGETAKELLKQAGASFQTLVMNDQLKKNVVDYVTGFPTTFFVDKTGKVIGQLQVGTPADEGQNKEAYSKLIQDALSKIK